MLYSRLWSRKHGLWNYSTAKDTCRTSHASVNAHKRFSLNIYGTILFTVCCTPNCDLYRNNLGILNDKLTFINEHHTLICWIIRNTSLVAVQSVIAAVVDRIKIKPQRAPTQQCQCPQCVYNRTGIDDSGKKCWHILWLWNRNKLKQQLVLQICMSLFVLVSRMM